MKRRRRPITIFTVAAIALLAPFWVAAAQTPEAVQSISEAYETAYDEDAPVRNFVYLFLRISGAAWIGVEWVAAITLVLGYRALRNAFPEPEGE